MTEAFHPATPERWPDLERFFSRHGNTNYCWCTYWRLSSTEYRDADSAERKRILHEHIRDRMPTGILGYVDGEIRGWCSVAPREIFERLARARSIVDLSRPNTWSIVCFFVNKDLRKTGYTSRLLEAAVDYARRNGAERVEAYPVDVGARSYRYMGYVRTFEAAGFRDVTPADSKRRILQKPC